MSNAKVERVLKSIGSGNSYERINVETPPLIRWGDHVITIDIDCMVSTLNIEKLNAMSHVAVSRMMIYNHDSYVFEFYDFTDTLIPPGLVLDVTFSNKSLEPDDAGKSFLLELLLNNKRVVSLPAKIDRVYHFNQFIH